MTIKMIVVDMDGTFLDQDNTYQQARFGRLFEQLVQRQIHFVVASGSQYQRLQHQFAPWQNQLDYISQNGAIVHHGQQLLKVDALADSDLKQVLQVITTHFPTGAIVQRTISGLKQTYVPKQTPAATLATIRRYYQALQLVDDFAQVSAANVQDQITKVGVTFGPTIDYSQAVAQLRAALPAGLVSQNSGFHTELIGNTGIDKVTGIQQLQARYQIAADEIMTFGDNENDLGMLQMTPHGFAMPNAAALIRQKAPQLALADHNHAGVLATIEQQLAISH